MDWEYLKRSEALNIVPNFYMSAEYFESANYIEVPYGHLIGIETEDDDIVFPYLGKQAFYTLGEKYFWIGFGSHHPCYVSEFLDYQYIYDPIDFQNLAGKKWHLFRKKINGFKKTNPKFEYKSINHKKELLAVFLQWLENREETETIHGDEVILKAIENPNLKNTKGLYIDDDLIGFNIWDENYAFINFRYSFGIPDKSLPGINYFLRYCFYTDPNIYQKKKMVNDGGILDNPSLQFFKNHLNPKHIYEIYSWRKK